MQLVQIRKAQSRMDVVLHVPRPELDPMRYHFMDRTGNAKIGFRRAVIAPLKWLDPGDPVSVCPDCGKPFGKARELADNVCYVGDCLEVHDRERPRSAATCLPKKPLNGWRGQNRGAI